MKEKKKSILFVDNEDVFARLNIENHIIILTTGIVTKKYKERRDIKHYSDFIEKYKNPNYFNTLYWLQKWAEKKISHGGKSIKEELTYNGFSLWYFIEYMMFYETKRPYDSMYHSISRITYTINIINNIIEKYKPKEIIIQNDCDLFYKLIIDCCKGKNIYIKNLNIKTTKHRLSKKLQVMPFLARSYLRLRVCLRVITSLFLKKNKKKTDLLIFSSERFCRDKIENNIIYGGLVKQFDKERIPYKLIEYDQIYYNKSITKFIKHIKNNGSTFVGQYYNLKTLIEIERMASFMRKKWGLLRRNKYFIKSLNYKGIDIYPYLEKRLNIIFRALGYFIADILALTNQMIKIEKPKIVVIEHDENYFGKGILVNAKNSTTKIISMQTELLYPEGCLARHINSGKVLDKEKPIWRPLPQIKCVQGEYGKNVLINFCNYPKNIIKVVGDAKYDEINTKIKNLDKGALTKKYNINKDKKLVVFAGGGVLPDLEILPALIKAIDELSNTKLIIKAHPAADIDLLRKTVYKTKSHNVEILTDADLFELISICDLFISVCSTVAIDAMVLDKPVMLINVVKCPMPYVKLGGAYGIFDVEDIKDGVSKGLYDKALHRKLFVGRKKFLKEYLYKLDGKASERIVDIIKKELE